MVNPEGLLCCVFRSQGRSYNLFLDFHILEDASEHDGLIVTVELLNEVTYANNVTLMLSLLTKKYIMVHYKYIACTNDHVKQKYKIAESLRVLK